MTVSGSEEDLKEAYGAANVSTSSIELGEGETAVGTILFPDDPLGRLEILWQDSDSRQRPARIILRGSRSLWTLPGGVTLGTRLQELERLNGRPFQLAGFAWDYEGVVLSWLGGTLERDLGPDVKVYLAPAPEDRALDAYSQVLGDRPYSSALPQMQRLDPAIYQILVDFNSP